MKKRALSAVQPTGSLHLGNYLGAIRHYIPLQEQYECFFFVADLHAITADYNPLELADTCRLAFATLIACGVDPQQATVFIQSQAPTHTELAWLLNCVARLGWLNRMTQFKEKAGKHKENASIGLYDYPVLMAADILAYHATVVPVGDDQKQHLELTRDIAQKFNHDFGGDFFPDVEPLMLGPITRVMSLRDGHEKMSKSAPSDFSRIHLTDDPDLIVQKIRKAKTDMEPLPSSVEQLENRPEAKNLVSIYAALSGQTCSSICREFAGQLFSEFKPNLADLIVASLEPISQKIKILMQDKGELDRVIRNGAQKAITVSKPIVNEVKKRMGMIED